MNDPTEAARWIESGEFDEEPTVPRIAGRAAVRRSDRALARATLCVQATALAGGPTPLPGVQPVSTVFFDDVASLRAAEAAPFDAFFYGGMGTPAVKTLETAIATLEGGEAAVATSSGSAAVATALLSAARAGGHALVTDAAASGTRRFCEDMLRPMGVEIEYYRPSIGGRIRDLFRPRTCLVYMESPGSFSFEVQDVPAIAAAARAHGVTSILDNSWGGLGLFRPFDHGVDVSVLSIGKQAAGHADVMLGAIVASKARCARIRDLSVQLGQTPGSLETYLASCGVRSLSVRGPHQERAALALAEWFTGRPEVRRVLCPALPGSAGQEIWLRDFSGAAGLLTVAFAGAARDRVLRALDRLELTRLGFGWGGVESLALPCFEPPTRTVTPAPAHEFWVRISAGLEDPADLIADWRRALDDAA